MTDPIPSQPSPPADAAQWAIGQAIQKALVEYDLWLSDASFLVIRETVRDIAAEAVAAFRAPEAARVCPLCLQPSTGQCRGDADCPLAGSRVPPEDLRSDADAARVEAAVEAIKQVIYCPEVGRARLSLAEISVLNDRILDCAKLILAAPAPTPKADCPHAAPHRYCMVCVENPCPVGLGGDHG